MKIRRPAGVMTVVTLVLLAMPWTPAVAQEEPSGTPVIDAFERPLNGLAAGSFRQTIPIAVPAFRGLEPRLALTYTSGGPNGFAGVGWALSGFGTVSRTRNGRGTPRYVAEDVYVLGGQELIPCDQAPSSPSCTTGGSHATKVESYARVRYEPSTELWSLWAKNGTRTEFGPVHLVPEGTYRWGQTAVTDTHGSSVSYSWACEGGDCYPDTVSYGPYSITLYREARPDILRFATGSDTNLGRTAYRLRSVLVRLNGTPVRAYELSYEQSPVTNRSRLVAVRQYGQDVAIDAEGQISGGTALPAREFIYSNDSASESITRWP